MEAIVCIPLLLGPHLLHWPGGASHCHNDLSWPPISVVWYHTAKKKIRDRERENCKVASEVISQQPQNLYVVIREDNW